MSDGAPSTPRTQGVSPKKLIGGLGVLALAMFGFGFAMVPLYNVFCEVLGIRLEDGNGRITEAQAAPTQVTDRWVTVHFDSSIESGLPWSFAPDQKFMKVRVGELSEAYYTARNLAKTAVSGHAVPAVAPAEASIHFAKTECFCFTRQQLAAGEDREMPVRFMLDPALPEDIKVVTLSYRFYLMDDPEPDLSDTSADQAGAAAGSP
ncbi:MAG: cytochrome c oxidase assembly protein [Pseudomonadota bacterium]